MLGGTACGMTSPQRCHLGAFVYQPAVPVHCIDTMHSRAYIGQFSGNGEVFIGALFYSCHQSHGITVLSARLLLPFKVPTSLQIYWG